MGLAEGLCVSGGMRVAMSRGCARESMPTLVTPTTESWPFGITIPGTPHRSDDPYCEVGGQALSGGQ